MLQLLVILRICCVPLPWMPSCPLEVSSCKQDEPCQWGDRDSHNPGQKYCMSTVVAETLKQIFERHVICNMGAEGASQIWKVGGVWTKKIMWFGFIISWLLSEIKLRLMGDIREHGNKVWEIGKNPLKQTSMGLSAFWILPSWKLCPIDSLGFMFTWNISRSFPMNKMISVLKWLKKEGVSNFASYLGATLLCHLTASLERHTVAPRDTQNIHHEDKISTVRTTLCWFSHKSL